MKFLAFLVIMLSIPFVSATIYYNNTGDNVNGWDQSEDITLSTYQFEGDDVIVVKGLDWDMAYFDVATNVNSGEIYIKASIYRNETAGADQLHLLSVADTTSPGGYNNKINTYAVTDLWNWATSDDKQGYWATGVWYDTLIHYSFETDVGNLTVNSTMTHLNKGYRGTFDDAGYLVLGGGSGPYGYVKDLCYYTDPTDEANCHAPPDSPHPRPVITGINLTSGNQNGDNVTPYTTNDTTPTFSFVTDVNANCSIGVNDWNYTTMGATRVCSGGQGTTSHTCTLPAGDVLNRTANESVYISCINILRVGNQTLTSTSGLLNTQVLSEISTSIAEFSVADGFEQIQSGQSTFNFNCSTTSLNYLENISIYLTDYHNSSWELNTSLVVGGMSGNFTTTISLGEGNYTWGCLGYDNGSWSSFSSNRTIIITYGNTIRGQIVDSNGRLIPNAIFQVSLNNSGNVISYNTTSNSTGGFSIFNVTRGVYVGHCYDPTNNTLDGDSVPFFEVT